MRSVAIVGAGFSGALLAVNLLRHDPRLHVQLIERRHGPGRGIAYSTAHPDHLLNVRAGNMSAFPDQPDHFQAWHRDRGSAEFARRLDYGHYLADLLARSAAGAEGRLTLVDGEATDARDLGDRVVVSLGDGRRCLADALVLALGNLPPPVPAGLVVDDDAAFVADPWAGPLHEGLGADDAVVLLGTGLTAVDVALALAASSWRGAITAVSRRGLLPHAHAPASPAPPLASRPVGPPAELLRQTRLRAAEQGWRAAVDALRPVTQALWRGATDRERRQFLRHLRPWWDVHRHRLAPEVAASLGALAASGRFSVVAGTPTRLGGGALIVRPRGGGERQKLAAARVINCTGPLGDLSRATDPLLKALLARGDARPDALRLGLDVDSECRLRDAAGRASGRLHAIGPMTRGAFWEINAVPDIRRQAWTLARRLTHSHWVGGEGL